MDTGTDAAPAALARNGSLEAQPMPEHAPSTDNVGGAAEAQRAIGVVEPTQADGGHDGESEPPAHFRGRGCSRAYR